MLTGTSFPTTALISNGIDRAERYCADTTPIWRGGTWRATTAVRPGPTGRPRTSKRSRISTPPTCRNAKRNWARTSTTSSTRSTASWRRTRRILYGNTYKRGVSEPTHSSLSETVQEVPGLRSGEAGLGVRQQPPESRRLAGVLQGVLFTSGRGDIPAEACALGEDGAYPHRSSPRPQVLPTMRHDQTSVRVA